MLVYIWNRNADVYLHLWALALRLHILGCFLRQWDLSTWPFRVHHLRLEETDLTAPGGLISRSNVTTRKNVQAISLRE